MEFTPETANSAAQLVAVLLVATMLDPWAKDSVRSGPRGISRWRATAAMLSYVAKVLAILVLLFDVQLLLFDRTWTGASARALALGNYAAVVAAGFTILMSVLTHIGALGGGERADTGGDAPPASEPPRVADSATHGRPYGNSSPARGRGPDPEPASGVQGLTTEDILGVAPETTPGEDRRVAVEPVPDHFGHDSVPTPSAESGADSADRPDREVEPQAGRD